LGNGLNGEPTVSELMAAGHFGLFVDAAAAAAAALDAIVSPGGANDSKAAPRVVGPNRLIYWILFTVKKCKSRS